jgi:hypothetical protein
MFRFQSWSTTSVIHNLLWGKFDDFWRRRLGLPNVREDVRGIVFDSCLFWATPMTPINIAHATNPARRDNGRLTTTRTDAVHNFLRFLKIWEPEMVFSLVGVRSMENTGVDSAIVSAVVQPLGDIAEGDQ